MTSRSVRTIAPESILFADDIVLCVEKEVDTTEHRETWKKALDERRMKDS